MTTPTNPSYLGNLNRLFKRRKHYKETFSTDHGKAVLADIYKYCAQGKNLHVPGDPHSTSYNTGKHAVLLHISALLNHSDEEIHKISNSLNQG